MKAFRGAMYGVLFTAMLVCVMVVGIIMSGKAFALPDDDVVAIGTDSWQATCGTFDELFNGSVFNDGAVATSVLQAVSEEYGITLLDAADVVNWQVYYFCDEHWDNLVAVGEDARSAGPVSLR